MNGYGGEMQSLRIMRSVKAHSQAPQANTAHNSGTSQAVPFRKFLVNTKASRADRASATP